MHQIILSLCLTFTSLLFQPDYTYQVPALRQLYARSAKDKVTCEKLARHLGNYKGQDPVVLGLAAGVQGLMAKFAWSPYTKLKHLRTSSEQFEKIISKHPRVAEVRFLRYSLEFFIPRYLNLSEHLTEDKKVFLESLRQYPHSDLDPEIYQTMRNFLLRHPEGLTEAEKKQLANIKA